MTFFLERIPEVKVYFGSAAPYYPLLMMLLFLQAVLGSKGTGYLLFSAAEVDFLFPGPFNRRELLLFKLVRRGLGIIVGALLLAMSPLVLAFHGRLAAFVGLTLSLAFINLSGLAVTLARLIVAEAAHSRVRKIVLVVVGMLVSVGLAQAIGRSPSLRSFEVAASFGSTWTGRVLLAPFQVFTNTALAERWFPDLVGWGAAAAAIDVAMLALVLKLDADYLEWSTAISQQVYETLQRLKRSGGAYVALPGKRSGRGLPRFPWAGGAGPIAARQLVLTARLTRGMVRLIVVGGVFYLGWRWMLSGISPGSFGNAGFGLGAIFYFMFLFQMALPVSFRGDVNHLDVLKSLPMRPLAIAAGELVGPALVFAVVQLATVGVYAVTTQTLGPPMIAVAALAFPVDVILLAGSSLAFLLYPLPKVSGVADLNSLGRRLMYLVIHGLVLGPLLGVAAGMGFMAYVVSGGSWAATIATGLGVLVAEIVPMTMLVALAFERFDVSTETPA